MTICPADTHVSPTGCPVSDRAAAFNPFEGAYQIDPAEALRWAREDEPVFYSPELGYWVVARYEDVKSVFRDPILFSPAIALEKITPAPPEAMEILKKHGFAMERTMVNEDEPQHMERRRLLLNAFLPEALAQHEDAIRRLTRVVKAKAGAEAAPQLLAMAEAVATADGQPLAEREQDALDAVRKGLGLA